MNIRNYVSLAGTNAFIAFVLYLYLELAQADTLKYLFLGLFVVFSIVALIDALQGEIKDKEIIGITSSSRNKQ